MRFPSQTIPPKISTSSSLKFFSFTVLGMALLGGAAVLFFFNPGTHNFYPVCLFHKLTGLNCPGCGSTRALYALLHGSFHVALRDNALLILSMTVFVIWGARVMVKKLRGQTVAFEWSSKILWAFLILSVVFGVLRNLPTFSFLSP